MAAIDFEHLPKDFLKKINRRKFIKLALSFIGLGLLTECSSAILKDRDKSQECFEWIDDLKNRSTTTIPRIPPDLSEVYLNVSGKPQDCPRKFTDLQHNIEELKLKQAVKDLPKFCIVNGDPPQVIFDRTNFRGERCMFVMADKCDFRKKD